MMRRHEVMTSGGTPGASGAYVKLRQGVNSAQRRGAVHIALAVLAALLLSLAAVIGAGCSSQQESSSPLTIDLAEGQASGISSDMGASPDGKTEFTLSPDRDVVKAYQEEAGSDVDTADMLEEWVDAVTTVTLDGRELTESPFNNWKGELENPQDDYDRLLYYDLVANEEDVTLTLPVGLFNDFDDNGVSEKHLVVESEGFDDVSGDVRFRKSTNDSITVRVLDTAESLGGTAQYEYTLTDDDLHSLPVQTGYESAANCGMAGIRSLYSEGVYLTDVLDAAGVEFGPGMTLQMRSGNSQRANVEDDEDYSDRDDGERGSDSGSYYGGGSGGSSGSAGTKSFDPTDQGVFTYEDLIETPRYTYPAVWDDETTYDELGGATVYELLADDIDAWKRDDEQSKTLARIIGESKVELPSPLIAWGSNVGVVGWGGVNPALQSYGSATINPYSEYSRYNLRYGLKANEDGSINDEFTVPTNYMSISCIDIFPTPDVDTEQR